MIRFIGCRLQQLAAATQAFFLPLGHPSPYLHPMGATKRRRLMVNLPPEIAPLVELRAKQTGRTVSNYIERLITEALIADGRLEESPSGYIITPHGPKEKPPDNPGRTTGAGPRHRVSKSA